MYHKVSISKLSKHQLLRLIKGHKIRVKHGSGHDISLSSAQHTLFERAKKLNKGISIALDPIQQELMTHGGSFHDAMKRIVNKIGDHVENTASNVKDKIGGKIRTKDVNKVLGHVGEELLKVATKTLGKVAERQLAGGELNGEALYAAGDNGGSLNVAGSGVKRRGRPKKTEGGKIHMGKIHAQPIIEKVLDGIIKFAPLIAQAV
jgi:hypothetical protein